MNYTLQLSLELEKQHDVHLLFTRQDRAREQYEVREGTYEGLPFTEIIHNGVWASFEQTYRDERIDEIFVRVFESVKPDVLHVQHLLFLSANLIRIAKARGVAVVFTLHDFWLMCPREIRMRPDLRLCSELSEATCEACILAPPMTTSRLERLALRLVKRLVRATGPKSLDALSRLNAALPRATIQGARHGLRRLARRFDRRPERAVASSGPGRSAIAERNAFLADVCTDVDLFVSPSKFLREEFIRFGFSESRILYSAHGHATARACDAAPRTRREGVLRFGYVGALARHKGVDTLIEAFDPIREPGVVLNIFGGANVNRDYARRLERSTTNPTIRFRGRFDPARIAEVYAEIDVLVMPSRCFENAPLTICEAFGLGIPVVTSKLGGMAELVRHGRNGLLFEPGNAHDLRDRLRSLVEDPAQVDFLARGIDEVKSIEQDARDFVERYSDLLRSQAQLAR